MADFQKHEIKENTIILMPPGQVHKAEGVFRGFVVAFTEDFLLSLSQNVRNAIKHHLFSIHQGLSVYSIEIEGKKELNEDFQRLLQRHNNPSGHCMQKDYIAALLSQLLLDIIQYGKREDTINNIVQTQEFQVYLDFMECVEHNFRTLHATVSYVDKVSVSLSTLNKYVTLVSGKTPARLIGERIALEAKRLLFENTEMRIKEIASYLGFEDSSNFVKFFRHHVGVSPIEFRETL